MAKKIVMIGAGSFGFTRALIRDILTFPAFEDCTLALVDINPQALDFSVRAAKRIIEEGGYHATVQASTERKELLPGADGVVCTLLAHPLDVYKMDTLIPNKYGVDTCVGDTRGPSGIFRFLRTVPVMLEILEDIRRLCPGAVFLNYTNPMAMLCRAMQEAAPEIVTSGLCHSVQGTAAKLAKWIGAPESEVTYLCAGVNHLAYYLNFKWNGKDAYPLIRKAVEERREIYEEDIVRNEMFLALGYYVTESSGHASEYTPWFRKRKDLLEEYCYRGTSWNPGFTSFSVNLRTERAKTWQKSIDEWFNEPLDLKRGNEYASNIFNAIFGDGTMYEFNGNVRNFGLIDSLPHGACVEVPVLASRAGLKPMRVGALPDAVLPLVALTSQIEEMAVKGSQLGDPTLVYQAICHDPLTMSVLSLREIRKMVDEMFAFNAPYLPQFKHLK